MDKKSPKEFFKYEYAIEMLDLMVAVADNNLVFAEAVTRNEGQEFDPKRWEQLKKEARKFLIDERRKRFEAALEKEKEI